MTATPKFDAAHFNRFGAGHLPGYLSIHILELGEGWLRSELVIEPHHLAPNGYLHAATIVALADTSAGYACVAHLPEGIANFTTIELKANFISTLREGRIACEARALHLGRTTQLWEARVTDAGRGKLMATFQCTQMLLPKR